MTTCKIANGKKLGTAEKIPPGSSREQWPMLPVESAQANLSGSSDPQSGLSVAGHNPPEARGNSWRPSFLWRIADSSVFGLWLAVVIFTLAHHEKWADEAQAWLIARDLPLRAIWFHELRYEGSPGLWHTILWIAQHVFHAPYATLGAIGVACAAAGAAFVLWKAPFPRPLRYLLIFSYFLLYQYAVVARSYVLFPLFAFMAADAYKDRHHPERITLAFVLLSLLCLHGALFSASLGLVFLVEATREWRSFDAALRRRFVICALLLGAVFLFAFAILKPSSDVDAFVKPAPSQHIWEAAKSTKLVSVISGALLDFTLPSMIFLGMAAAWCFTRRQGLAFLLPTAALIFLYVFIHGQSHHHGTVFVAVIAGLWIAWPTAEEQRCESAAERRANRLMMVLLGILCAVNIWDATVSVRYEYLYPYSGAEDAAQYLRSVDATKSLVFGYTYGAAAVNAYFDHNVFGNLPNSYYHHGSDAKGAFIDLPELQRRQPEFLVFLTGSPAREIPELDPVLRSYGYEMVHFSDGYLFFKRSLMDRQVYVVYRLLAGIRA